MAIKNKRRKNVLTTGEVAKICHVAPRTVSKWFDTGKLRGYRIPGSRDRRIPKEHLMAFMRVHGMPTDELEVGQHRVLLIGENMPDRIIETLKSLESYQIRTASNGFEAGVAAQQFQPHVIILETSGDNDTIAVICRNIKSNASFSGIRIIAVNEKGQAKTQDWYAEYGFDFHLDGVYTLEELMGAIEGAKKVVQI